MEINFDFIFTSLSPLLRYKNCSFGYQRKNCRKHGHVKKRYNRITGDVSYELKIEKNDIDAALIYTFIHELTHHINDHLDSNKLFYWQQEWVADQVALYFINKFELYNELQKSLLASKWDISKYSSNYINGKKLTKARKDIMQSQKTNTIMKMEKLISNNIKP